MGRGWAGFVVGLTAVAAAGCGGAMDEGIALQAAGIVAALDRTDWSAPDRLQGAYRETVLCIGIHGGPAGGADPDPALLEALEAEGYAAVGDSDCEIPENWSPSSDQPFSVTSDGRTGLNVSVESPDLEAGRITVGVNPWPMMEYFFECTAAREGSAWTVASCEELPDL